MITENLSTLKIHKLTQAQYDREREAGKLDQTALYLTPDEATYSPICRASSNGYGERLVVPYAYYSDILADGVEILVCPVRDGRCEPDGTSPTLKVGDTDEYNVTSGDSLIDASNYGVNYWNKDDVLRFRFDEANSKWLLVENITQHIVYAAAWTFVYTETCPESTHIEMGKTYQIYAFWNELCVQWQFYAKPLPSNSYILLPVHEHDGQKLTVKMRSYGDRYGFVPSDGIDVLPVSGFYYRVV